jgi:hypothetical protein
MEDKGMSNSKLLHKNHHQRFYEVDFDIIYCKSVDEVKNVKDIIDVSYQNYKFREGHNKEIILRETKRAVCISDATTHAERLAFSWRKIGGEYLRTPFTIAGKMTDMINGGDTNCVYDDEVYIRYLRMLNNKQ